MAYGQIHFAALDTPPAPVGQIHYALMTIPEGVYGQIHFAALTTPSGSLAYGQIHHAALVTPASPDALPPSGIRQLGSDGAWRDVAVYQRSSSGEWL